MKKITIPLFEFNELNEGAQERAVSDYIDFEIQVADKDSYIWDSIEEAERLQTPWFTGSIVYENHKEEIVNTIEINEYLFFADGELVPVSYYDQAV